MGNNIDASVNQRFSSRIGFLLSALGVAIGTGNIWRFPRIAASNGGDSGAGAFLIAWIIFLFAWSIPLIIAEYAIGRKYRKSVIGSIINLSGEKFGWMGTFIAFVSTAISFFYAVVVGWCLYYFFQVLVSPLPSNSESSLQIWNNFQSGYLPILFHALAIGLGTWAIWKGINSIEKVNKVLMPVLLVIIIFSLIRSLTLPGAINGVKYLFIPQLDQLLKPKIWLEALTQNAWDTGAGWGLFLTYAAYMKKNQSIIKNAFSTAIGNNTISLIAGMMIFGTVFSVLQNGMGMTKPEVLEIMKSSGPAATGLTFIWMPQLFEKMYLGNALSILFFLGLTFAGFSSLIAMLELAARVFVNYGFSRKKSISIVVAVIYLLGIPSALNLNILTNQDFVWANALVLSGFFIAFSIMKYGVQKFREEELQVSNNNKLIKYWDLVIKFVVPILSAILLFWWLSQSISSNWYNPFGQYTLMTNAVQWFLLIIFSLMIKYRKFI